MQRISYAGGSVVTGDAIAIAVLEYGAALANLGRATAIDVPVLRDGARDHVRMLLGPASQLISEHEESRTEELDDPAYVREVESRITELNRPWALPSASVLDPLDFDER